jgi:hypothetical protein
MKIVVIIANSKCKMEKSKIINFFISRRNCEWIMVQRKHDILLFVPQEKFKLKHMHFLKEQGFEMFSKPTADPLIFFKYKSQALASRAGGEE